MRYILGLLRVSPFHHSRALDGENKILWGWDGYALSWQGSDGVMRSSRMPERSRGGINDSSEDAKTMLRLLGSGDMGWSKERMSFWCGLVCYRFNHNDRGETESDTVLRGEWGGVREEVSVLGGGGREECPRRQSEAAGWVGISMLKAS
jgi:hypothetical protein